jgi:transglutaminase-like putative cysteine protease
MLTPRSTFERLEFGKPRVEIGYAADQMIDLNHTGDLRANQQVAFEVTATAGDGPKTDLPPDQRWRGRTLRRYQTGVWHPGDLRLPSVEPTPRIGAPWSPPELGPGQCTLTFEIPPGARGRFLADPVAWAPQEPPPVATLGRSGYRPWVWGGDGSFLSDLRSGTNVEPLRYVQVWRQGTDPDLGPPFQLIEPDLESVLRPLRENPVPKVKEYADRLIDRLIRDGKLPADYRDPVTLNPRAEFHDRIARDFTTHLATTPDLTYTTELRREKKGMDPIEEFLYHTRAGHCERFATALALMLRSQGIPAILVLGFKGCEPTDEPGKYVVRQEHAHAWVEALIEYPEPTQRRGDRPVSRWLSLDPTPGGEPATAAESAGWVGRAGSWLRGIYDKYVTDYSQEERERALRELAAWATRADVLGTAGGVLAAVLAARFLLRRRNFRTAPPTNPLGQWFGRLLALLAAHGFAPAPGETPREFAIRVSDTLRRNPAAGAVAEVPLDWVEAYYETRFGGRPPTPDRLAALDARLDDLRLGLAAR